MTFETYRPIEQYAINNIKQDYPSCFNGMVRVKRYKVTIEEIEEPKEVLCERLEKLWCESDNYHDYEPLVEAAKQLGYEFKNSIGCQRKSK